jgi:hypothetical protein
LIHQNNAGIDQRPEINHDVALPFEFPCLQAIRKRNEATVSEWNYKVLKETCEICLSAKNAEEKLLFYERRKNMQTKQPMQKQDMLVEVNMKNVALASPYLPCNVLSVYDYLPSSNLNKRVFFFKRVFFKPKNFRAVKKNIVNHRKKNSSVFFKAPTHYAAG